MEEQRIYTDLYEAFDDTYVIDKIYDALLKEDGLSDEEKAAITQRNNYERDCVIIDNGNIILIACNEFGDELDYDDDHFTCFIQPSEKKVILTNRPKRNNKEVVLFPTTDFFEAVVDELGSELTPTGQNEFSPINYDDVIFPAETNYNGTQNDKHHGGFEIYHNTAMINALFCVIFENGLNVEFAEQLKKFICNISQYDDMHIMFSKGNLTISCSRVENKKAIVQQLQILANVHINKLNIGTFNEDLNKKTKDSIIKILSKYGKDTWIN